MATCRVGFMATSACPAQRERRLREHRVRLVPPRASTSSNNNGPTNKFSIDRRDMLLGLGGAAASAATVMTPGGVILPAMANPVRPTNLSKCDKAKTTVTGLDFCCPQTPAITNIADIPYYDFPRTPLRVRRPAHEVKEDPVYMNKYRKAVAEMKKWDRNHPWNFYEQALVHCQYCNGGYKQVDDNGVELDVPIQVHFSWLFLPWHRYYIHFYERILGKLIDDDTFTLPYWNFDVKEGMTIPEIFTCDTESPLYNKNRNTDNYHPKILDYKYKYVPTGPPASDDELVEANLKQMQSLFKNNMQEPEAFMGQPLRAGEALIGSGLLESIHNKIHQFVGTSTKPFNDMGDFSTAGFDCVFYSLHANVDRLWHLYRNFRGNQKEWNDPDWLQATFVFYDEYERLVRVKVEDCLNPTKLRYTYEEVPIPWMGSLKAQKTKETKSDRNLNRVHISDFGTQPRKLGTNPLRVMVPRPKTNRSMNEKHEKVEMLEIKDIDVESHGPVSFDVYVAEPYGDLAGPDFGAFVGSFVRLPHKTKEGKDGVAKHKGTMACLKLGLTAVLEDIEADHVEKLVVTIVPGGGDVTVGGIQLNLVQADRRR